MEPIGAKGTMLNSQHLSARTHTSPGSVHARGAIFRKISNRDQTDTNEMATTETKYQTDFYSAKNTNILPKDFLKIPIKYQENTNKFGTEILNTDLVLVFSWHTKFLVSDWYH